LDGTFESRIVRGSKQKMNVVGHENKSVQEIAAFASIMIKSLEKQSRVVLDLK
jgi:hypothetical protein